MEMCPNWWCSINNSARSDGCLSSLSVMTLIVEVEALFLPSEAEVVGPPFRLNSTGVALALRSDLSVDGDGGTGATSVSSSVSLLATLVSPSSSLMIPLGNAIGSMNGSTRSALTQKDSKFENPGARENVATLFSRLRGIVRLCRPASQDNVQVFPSVRSLHLPRSFRVVAWVCAQCCGLRRRTFPSGTKYEFGILNSVTMPWSSSHFHRRVPDFTLVARDPPKPFTTRLLGRIEPGSKSPMSCDIHAVHRLSTPTFAESVSKRTSLSFAIVACACMAKTDMAMTDVDLDRQEWYAP
jgi:hypothetical protein